MEDGGNHVNARCMMASDDIEELRMTLGPDLRTIRLLDYFAGQALTGFVMRGVEDPEDDAYAAARTMLMVRQRILEEEEE
jgi:hypothetical protein